jgi:hypothetical protein
MTWAENVTYALWTVLLVMLGAVLMNGGWP